MTPDEAKDEWAAKVQRARTKLEQTMFGTGRLAEWMRTLHDIRSLPETEGD